MKQLVIKYPVITFFVINIFTVIIFGGINMTFFPSSANYMFILPQFAPMSAAILVIAILYGKSGVYDLMRMVSFRNINVKWSFVAMFIPIIVCGISYILLFVIVETKQTITTEFNRPPWNYALCMLFAVLGSYGEELGWRGFMLPQLQKKHSRFISSLIVGFLWGLWHFKFHSGILVFTLYTFLVIEFSLIISWLYSKTKGNIISAIIFHTAVNLCSLVLFEKVISDSANQYMQILLYGIYGTIFLFPCIFAMKKSG